MSRAPSFLLLFMSAGAALGCGAAGEHYESPADAVGHGDAASNGRTSPSPSAKDASNAAVAALAPGEGVLEVSARGRVTSYLGATHAVVTNAAGQVVAGADEDAEPALGHAAELTLRLPASDDYTLSLSATPLDAAAESCRASIGPLQVEPGAAARVRVFAWDCGERIGYVPETAAQACYWLADWTVVGRTRAAVGEEVRVAVVAPERMRYRWSSAAPELGRFSAPAAAQTALRCQAPGEDLAFQVAVTDGECEQLVTQTVSCE